MTEELTPDFEAFSELLDQEECELPTHAHTADAQLLLELRRNLRADTPLPSDFASRTAERVEARFRALPWTEKLFTQSRTTLFSSAFRGRNVALSTALVAVAWGLGSWDRVALLSYGLILGGFLGWWSLKERASGIPMPRVSRTLKLSTQRLADGAFYLFPTLAILASSLSAASLLYGLGSVSISFQENREVLRWFSAVVGVGILLLLFSAARDLWKVYRARASSRPWQLACFQALHAGWFLALLQSVISGAAAEIGLESREWQDALSALGYATVVLLPVIVVYTYRCSEPGPEIPPIGPARRALLSSFLLGFLPIAFTILGFYEMQLTREIKNQSLYQEVMAESEAALQKELKTPDSENGWIEVQDLFRSGPQPRANPEVTDLKGPAEYYLQGRESYRALTPEQRLLFSEKERDFLTTYRRVAKAIEKPSFTHLPTEGVGFQNRLPNFITYRSVSQSLAMLSQKAWALGNTDQAIDWAVANLRWSNHSQPNTLIEMMISIAQLAIAQVNLEEMVLSGKLDEGQLSRLARAAQEARFRPAQFADTLKREAYITDKAFRDFFINGAIDADELENLGLPHFMAYLPKRFWESERKAYWNYQLEQLPHWSSVTSGLKLEEMISPFNVLSSSVIPNFIRAQVQFAYSHSKLTAVEVMCQLERFKLRHGHYPKKLEALVPDYLPSLPQDLMDPKPLWVKGGFDYRLTGNGGYLLLSESPEYQRIGLQSRQVYGHDGNLEEQRSD